MAYVNLTLVIGIVILSLCDFNVDLSSIEVPRVEHINMMIDEH